MRALVTIHGGYSYVQPIIPLARALQAAGHEVKVACQPRMVPVVESAGLSAVAAFEDTSSPPTVELVRAQAPEVCRRLLALADTWQPDVVVREWAELGGLVVAVEHGLKCAVCAVKIRPAPASANAHPCMTMLNAAVSGFGGNGGFDLDFPRLMSRMRGRPSLDLSLLFGDLWLSFYPPSLALPGTPKLSHEYSFRPPLHDTLVSEPTPGWLADLGPDPIVFATLGTTFNQAEGVFEAIIAALSQLPVELVVTVGPDRDPALLGRLPSHVHVCRYIPYSEIMPRATASVIHGGLSTILASLANGVPFVCLPLGGDQPINAARCAELGVSLTYSAAGSSGLGLRPGAVDAGLIGELTTRVLAEPGFAAAAKQTAAEIGALPDIGASVGLIEDMVSGR